MDQALLLPRIFPSSTLRSSISKPTTEVRSASPVDTAIRYIYVPPEIAAVPRLIRNAYRLLLPMKRFGVFYHYECLVE